MSPISRLPSIEDLDLSGWFSPDEGAFYADLASKVHGAVVVEVGSWKGLSTSYVGPVCMAQGTRLVCVDHWKGSHDAFAEAYEALLAEEDVRGIFEANVRRLGIDVEILAEPSVEAAERFAPASINLVFLDASHDAPSVRADLSAWWPKLVAGGILAGHDYSTRHPGVMEAVDVFANDLGLDVIRGPGSIYRLDAA